MKRFLKKGRPADGYENIFSAEPARSLYYFCKDSSGGACDACRMRILSQSFILMVLSVLFKGTVGFFSGSQALIAEAVHSCADSVTYGVNYAGAKGAKGSKVWQSVLIGAIMLLLGVWVCADNAKILIVGSPARPGLLSLVIAVSSVYVNWLLYSISECANARNSGDQNIFMCLVQNRTNFLSAVLAASGILLSELGFVSFDPFCAIAIGCLLVYGSLEIFEQAFADLPSRVQLDRATVYLPVGCLAACIIGFFAYNISGILESRSMVLLPSQGATTASLVDGVLGRARYFIIINGNDGTTETVLNNSRRIRGDVSNDLVAIVNARKVGVVIAKNVGKEMFEDLSAEDVLVYYLAGDIAVRDAYQDYLGGNLEVARTPNVERGFGRGWLTPW